MLRGDSETDRQALYAKISRIVSPRGQVILRDVDIEIGEPGLYWIAGDTGSGKTTLLKALAGLIPNVYKGYSAEALIRVWGRAPQQAASEGMLDLVPNPSTLRFLTNRVRDELALNRAPKEVWEALRPHLGKPVYVLSDGEKYLVITLLSLSTGERRLLMLDEPQSNLDDENLDRIASLFEAHADNREVIIVATMHGSRKETTLGRDLLSLPNNSKPTAKGLPLPREPEGDASLLIEDCSFAYPGRPLFKELSLKLGPGDAVAITGANGSGKTTLLKLSSGIMKCSVGHARRKGIVRIIPSPHSHVFFKRTILEELKYPADMAGYDVGKVLEEIGLWRERHRDPYTLSTGEARILLYARHLIEGPNILVVDEPLRGLSEELRKIVLDSLRRFRDAGGIVLAAMLRPWEARGVFDKVYAIDGRGSLVEVSL